VSELARSSLLSINIRPPESTNYFSCVLKKKDNDFHPSKENVKLLSSTPYCNQNVPYLCPVVSLKLCKLELKMRNMQPNFVLVNFQANNPKENPIWRCSRYLLQQKEQQLESLIRDLFIRNVSICYPNMFLNLLTKILN